MPARWIIFRIICILQIMTAAFLVLHSLYRFFYGISFGPFMGIIYFSLVMSLSVLGLNLLNNNYPDTPVANKQKTQFNRLYLLNFLFLAFHFGFIFSEYRQLKTASDLVQIPVLNLPFSVLYLLYLYGICLLLQLIILYGLFELRRELYINFTSKKFEFEK